MWGLVVVLGSAFWKRNQIIEWANGGAPQIRVKAELRGQARHSIAYVEAHGGRVRRPIVSPKFVVHLGGIRAAELAR